MIFLKSWFRFLIGCALALLLLLVVGSCDTTSTDECRYANCTELRRDYPSGVSKGHCAYRPALDRDNDNHACEIEG